MNQETTEYLHFDVCHIISVELKPEIAANCKLRSNFVHEKLLETKNNLSGNPLLLRLCNKGLKLLNPDSQALIMCNSIHRISYTACDRSSCQFAMVARSTENGNSQFCHILRMNTVEEADTVNRYIGALFKNLNQKRRQKKPEPCKQRQSLEPVKSVEDEPAPTPPVAAAAQETPTKLRSTEYNIYDDLDARLRRISTPHIDELVSEKHFVRRLSLCIPSPTAPIDDGLAGAGEDGQPMQPLLTYTQSSSLEKKPSSSGSQIGPLLRKKSDYNNHKPNKISAVIERLSFRASRDMSGAVTDIFKSGSPVVALKEQLESFDPRFGSGGSAVAPAAVKKRFAVPAQTDESAWRMKPTGGLLARKNSAPIALELAAVTNGNPFDDEQQPPVPPVRINSLRTPGQQPRPQPLVMNESPLMRCRRAENRSSMAPHLPLSTMSAIAQVGVGARDPLAGVAIAGSGDGPFGDDDDGDDQLSSITTPSSCDDDMGPSVMRDMYGDDARKYRIQNSASSHKMNFGTSFNDSQYRSSFNNNENHCVTNMPISYFKNFTKDETTDFLVNKELGSFILRNSASHQGCFALSVKVSEISVSHYIIQSSAVGFQIKGLDKTWPSLHSLITHLSVIPEMLPCPLIIHAQPPPNVAAQFERKSSTPSCKATVAESGMPHSSDHFLVNHTNLKKQFLPQSKSADEEYQHRMRQFLNDSLIPPDLGKGAAGQEQYQQLSDFSSMVASFDMN